MFKELEKFKTGNIIDGIGVLPDKRELPIKLDEYSAGFGDLISDFIDHKKKHFWQRNYYHDLLTNAYIKMLNQVSITKGF